MKSQTRKEKIECSCGQHILLVTHDVDVNVDDLGRDYVQEEYYLSMFTYGYGGNNKPSLKWRLKTAWNVLTKGTMHEDSICMTTEEAKKLKDFL